MSRRRQGFTLLETVIVFAIIAMLILPMPGWLLDLGLALSITLSVMILLTALQIERPLDLSAFPTTLLIATMLRLGLNLASTRLQLGDSMAASAALEKSLEIAPNQAATAEALVATALSSGDVARAQSALDRLKAQVGDTEPVILLQGLIRLAQQNLDGARAEFARAAQLFPQSLNARTNLGKVLLLLNKREEGEAALREVLEKDPANIQALNTLVQVLTADQRASQAITLLEAARKASPQDVALTAGLSDLLARNGVTGQLAVYAGNGRGGFSGVLQLGRGWGRGSGVVTAPGVVITNAHVLRGEEVAVTFADGRTELGRVAGADADLVLWDPSRRVTLTNALMQHAIDYTPYEGLAVTGWPVATVRRGEVVMRDGSVTARPGTGRYLPVPPYAMIQPRGVLADGFDAAASG